MVNMALSCMRDASHKFQAVVYSGGDRYRLFTRGPRCVCYETVHGTLFFQDGHDFVTVGDTSRLRLLVLGLEEGLHCE